MNPTLDRRSFLSVAGAASALAAVTTSQAAAAPAADRPLLLLGIACSPRAGKTTAQSVRAALDAAARVSPRIRTQLIDLGGRRIAGWSPQTEPDDFDTILPALKDPELAGLIIGSPCYFRSLSSLCKAFIERCMPLREAPAPLGRQMDRGPRGRRQPQWRAGTGSAADPHSHVELRDDSNLQVPGAMTWNDSVAESARGSWAAGWAAWHRVAERIECHERLPKSTARI